MSYFTIGIITSKILFSFFLVGFFHICIKMFIAMVNETKFTFPIYLTQLYDNISKLWYDRYYDPMRSNIKASYSCFVLCYIGFMILYPLINTFAFPITFTLVIIYVIIILNKIIKDIKEKENKEKHTTVL